MKTEKQIRKRLRQLKYRAFQKKAQAELKVVPPNCTFNQATSTKFPDGRPFRVCGLALDQEPHEFLGCNEPGDAVKCMTFVHRADRGIVKESIEQTMSDPDVGPREYPVVTMLMWVLDEKTAVIEEPTRWEQFWSWVRRRHQ